jgi:hypothetical protein
VSSSSSGQYWKGHGLQELLGISNRRGSRQLGARPRRKTDRGGRGDLKDVLTTGGDRREWPDFEEGRRRSTLLVGTVPLGRRCSGARLVTGISGGDAARCGGLVGFDCGGSSGGIMWRRSSGHGRRRTAGGGVRHSAQGCRAGACGGWVYMGTQRGRVRGGCGTDTGESSAVDFGRVRHGHEPGRARLGRL